MSLKSIVLGLLAAAVLVASPVSAQVVSSKGMGSVQFAGSKAKPADRLGALQKAQLSAIETYVAESSVAKMKIFDARRAEFATKLDRLILGSVVLSENEDKGTRTYTVVVRAEVNATLLRAELDAGSATANASPSARSLVATMFVARMQDSVKSFQDREYRRVDATSRSRSSGSYTERTTEGESIGPNSIGTNDNISRSGSGIETSSATIETGGSTTRKADRVQWNVTTVADVNTAMTGVLGNAGYEVVDAEYIEPQSGGLLNVARVRKEFATGNDLSAAVLRDTAAGIARADIKLLAYGTLDVGMRDTDPATGLVRVHVTVSGKVLDLSGRFPRTLSAVGPVQFAGIGPSETEARTRALQGAAEKAARIVVDELNVRQVR